jgi:hypothetical protein
MRKALIPRLPSGLAAVGIVVGTASAADLLSPERLERVNVAAESTEYRGKPALRLVEAAGASAAAETLAVVPGVSLRDGTIELELAGAPRASSEVGGARGFVGVAFRLQKDPLRYECFYSGSSSREPTRGSSSTVRTSPASS